MTSEPSDQTPVDEKQSDGIFFGHEQVSSKKEKTEKIQSVFNTTSTKYDFMNDAMSFGLHRVWKKQLVDSMNLNVGDKILDLAAGTCDLGIAIAKKYSGIDIYCADPCSKMIAIGRDKCFDHGVYKNISFLQCMAENIPFPSATFQAISIAFGFRNFTDQHRSLQECFRILLPGGKLMILEFSKPQAMWINEGYKLYSQHLLPLMGEVLANNRSSYQYLVDSIEKHPSIVAVEQMFYQVGFKRVYTHTILSGLVCIHEGVK